MNQDKLAKAMERLMDDEGFVKATLGAAKATEATGKETEYAVFETAQGQNITEPRVLGERNGPAISLDGYAERGDRLVYHGHTHPALEMVPEPSNSDLAMADLNSTSYTPIFGVCANSPKHVNGVAFRRREPVSRTRYYLTGAIQITNSLLKGVLGLNTDGIITPEYRRFANACKKGFKEARAGTMDVYDVVPDTLAEMGYEAASFYFRKDYRGAEDSV